VLRTYLSNFILAVAKSLSRVADVLANPSRRAGKPWQKCWQTKGGRGVAGRQVSKEWQKCWQNWAEMLVLLKKTFLPSREPPDTSEKKQGVPERVF